MMITFNETFPPSYLHGKIFSLAFDVGIEKKIEEKINMPYEPLHSCYQRRLINDPFPPPPLSPLTNTQVGDKQVGNKKKAKHSLSSPTALIHAAANG